MANKAKDIAEKIIAGETAQLSAADISRLKALTFLAMGQRAANHNDVTRNLDVRTDFLEDPANGFCSSPADELVQLADEHERLLQQEAPEAELQLLAMVVEAVWSALMGAMEAKGFADKLPKDAPDMREQDTEDLRQLVTRARELVPLLSTPAVLGRFTAPALAALLATPEGEPLPADAPAFDAVNGWTAVVGLLLGHFCSARELACVRKIISRLPDALMPSADDLARRRPVPDFDGMRAFVVSRLEEAVAEADMVQSVSADFAAVEGELRQPRADMCVATAFANGAGLAAHLYRQLSRRVNLQGQEVYSGGCCALDAMRLMAEVEERCRASLPSSEQNVCIPVTGGCAC